MLPGGHSRSPTWSRGQYATAMLLAIMDGSAAVQTATGQNKRHWHPHGRLPPRTALIVAAEAVGQLALVAWLFAAPADAWLFGVRAAVFALAALAALWTVPLHAQRPLSILLFLAAAHLAPAHLPPTPGVGEWLVRLVLPAKYLVSHPVRHEAYR